MSSDCLPACLSFCLSVRPSLLLPVRLCCCLAVWLSVWMLSSLARSSTLCFLINLAIFCQLFERFGEAPAAPETEHVVGNRVSRVRAGYTGCVRAQGYAKVIDSSNFSFGFGFCFAFCFGCDSFNSFFFYRFFALLTFINVDICTTVSLSLLLSLCLSFGLSSVVCVLLLISLPKQKTQRSRHLLHCVSVVVVAFCLLSHTGQSLRPSLPFSLTHRTFPFAFPSFVAQKSLSKKEMNSSVS